MVILRYLCSGLIVASNEDELTFREFFESLKFDDLKELMGDGSKAISKAKENVWPKDPFENSDQVNSTSSDPGRLMCWPHVDRASTKEIPKQYISDIKMDISQIQLSQTRKEFDLAWTLFKEKWNNIEDDQIDAFIHILNQHG